MDRESFNEGMRMLQMASRESATPEILNFYFRYINEKASPNRAQWLKAVDQLIMRGTLRLPSLGDLLKAVQAVLAEDAVNEAAAARRRELQDLEQPRTELQRRFITEVLRPLAQKFGKWDEHSRGKR